MNFREFVIKSQEHLVCCGWRPDGHNGVWSRYTKGPVTVALPAALLYELEVSTIFAPVVEEYLLSNGWHRTSKISTSWPVFQRSGFKPKKLPNAMLEQTKNHRLDTDAMSPRTTPSELVQLMTPQRSGKGALPPVRW